MTNDRLSGLSDDLLRRILYFVPSKDAARTSLLSRRWGSLWRSSGAVNLAVQVQGRHYDGSYSYHDGNDAVFSCQEAFVRGAKAALDAAEVPISRLTLRVECNERTLNQFLRRSRDWRTDTDVVGAIVSHPAARHVEELRVAAGDVSDLYSYLDQEIYKYTGIDGGYRLASLPSSETLRVLDLTRCDLTADFPSPLSLLATLQLRFCSVEPNVLQALLDGAPKLTTVQLEFLLFSSPNEPEAPALRLSLQVVTTLVLSSCGMQVQGSRDRLGCSWSIEIDAPRLQSFKYKGLLRQFVLRTAAAGVAQVDLHFLQGQDYIETIRSYFWQFVHNFTNARTIKHKVDNDLKYIAAIGEASGDRLLQCVFPRVERLELEGAFSSMDMERERLELEWMNCPEGEEGSSPSVEHLKLEGVQFPERETVAMAIANLLDCCPVLGEFMLKLSAMPDIPAKDSRYGQEFLKRKDRSDYSKSIDRFVRRMKVKTNISTEDSFFGDKYSYDDVRDIPGLSGRSFACLQRTLRRVGLQFQLDNNSIARCRTQRRVGLQFQPDNNPIFICLGLRLTKFFADHARVLEEMYVDIGNRRLDEHLNFNVETQMALAPKPTSATVVTESSSEFSRMSSATLDSTTDLANSKAGFTVLPLQRQERMDCGSLHPLEAKI